MKTPAEYLQCPVFELTYPTGESAESVPVVAYNDALRAVESALADAEKYRYLLMRALRRTNAVHTVAPSLIPTLPAIPETPVFPLYPEDDELAA
ncbi:hypothetical protein [Hymenobacter sp.]|jgi:hypothetical protein|uniref:hypothetical protein n=1 Tax=Hymenobacter sp. TaxID=1898978 RepID=UPI002EDA66B5